MRKEYYPHGIGIHLRQKHPEIKLKNKPYWQEALRRKLAVLSAVNTNDIRYIALNSRVQCKLCHPTAEGIWSYKKTIDWLRILSDPIALLDLRVHQLERRFDKWYGV
jgi:hypothetical protein